MAGKSASGESNGFGRAGTNGFSSYLPIIISTILILLTFFGAFWSVTDPRGRLDRHDEKIQFNRDAVIRLEVALTNIRKELSEEKAERIKLSEEQARRTGAVERLAALEKRHDALMARHDSLEKSFSGSITINDEIKRLNDEIQSLQRRIFVPANGGQRGQ